MNFGKRYLRNYLIISNISLLVISMKKKKTEVEDELYSNGIDRIFNIYGRKLIISDSMLLKE